MTRCPMPTKDRSFRLSAVPAVPLVLDRPASRSGQLKSLSQNSATPVTSNVDAPVRTIKCGAPTPIPDLLPRHTIVSGVKSLAMTPIPALFPRHLRKSTHIPSQSSRCDPQVTHGKTLTTFRHHFPSLFTFLPEASTAFLSPPPLRLLPGGAIQFPGGPFIPLWTSAFHGAP